MSTWVMLYLEYVHVGAAGQARVVVGVQGPQSQSGSQPVQVVLPCQAGLKNETGGEDIAGRKIRGGKGWERRGIWNRRERERGGVQEGRREGGKNGGTEAKMMMEHFGPRGTGQPTSSAVQ